MPDLQEVLDAVRDRAERYRGSRAMGEQNTKSTLIEPVLRALGWNVGDLEEVQLEYKRTRADNPVDYALLTMRKPLLFVEAKALGRNLDDRKWANQIISYATMAGVQWVALTDGDEWRVFNSIAAVPIEKKLFRAVRITDDESPAAETLSLLSKDRLEERHIDRLWEAYFVDRQVKAAVEDLFGAEPDASLVRLLRKRTELKPSAIRQSLARAELDIRFPLATEAVLPSEPAPRERREDKKTRRQPIGVSCADLIAAGLLKAPLQIERMYKGQRLAARIEENGAVTFGGRRYSSLSTAGSEARRTVVGRQMHTNGWDFWKFHDSDDQLRRLDVLRQRFLGVDETHRR
jgi:predicted type IV restriction endonuclease